MRFRPRVFTAVVAAVVSCFLTLPASAIQLTGDTYDARDCGNETERVLLTYDDWPYDSSVDRLLAHARQLKRLRVGAMYFPIGSYVDQYRQNAGINVTARLRRLRQMVGNHSWTHPRMPELNRAEMLQQVDLGVVSTQFRHPYGYSDGRSVRIVESRGYHDCSWHVDTGDWTGKSARQICASVLAQAGPGDTVLMHMRQESFKATRCIVRGLRNKVVDGKPLRLCRPWRNAEGRPVRTPVHLPYSINC